MSVYIISLVILCVILVGAFRKVDCYQSFIDGAKEGIDTSLNMFVYLLVFTVAISTINNSQIIEFLSCFFNGKYLLICLQCLVRPLSSSGSLSLMINNYHHFGVDNKKVERINYNIENARKNMIRAFDELNIETLNVEIICTADYESVAKALVNCWQKNIGVELNGIVTVLEETDFSKRLRTDDFDMAISSLVVDSNNPADFLSMFTTDNEKNIMNYSSAEFDRLVNELKLSVDNNKVVYCESYLLKNAVVLPLYAETTTYAVHKDTNGIYFSGSMGNSYFYKSQK